MATRRTIPVAPSRAAPRATPRPVTSGSANRLVPTRPAAARVFNADTQVMQELLRAGRQDVRPSRVGDYLHVSDLIGRCARLRALAETQGVLLPGKNVSFMDAITYRQGDAIHDLVRERAAVGAPREVFGIWRCLCGRHKTAGACTLAQAGDDPCPYCLTKRDRYEEITLRDESLMVVGHPDLLLSMDAGIHVVEIKSMSAQMFGDLTRPLPEHVVQVLFYFYLLTVMGFVTTGFVTIVYVTKGYMFRGSPIKEFNIVVESQEWLQERLRDYIEAAEAILSARAGGALPPRINCASSASPEARACPGASKCFAPEGSAAPVRFSYRQAVDPRSRR